MVKPEEKSLTAPLPLGSQTAAAAAGGRRPLHHHNPAVRKAVAARTAAAAAGGPQSPVPIVRAQIRLPPPPDQLSEKTLSGEGGGGSGGSTPVLSRKIELASAASPSPLAKGGSGSAERRVPKSVASMVRR
jgi:hypothetical protein